MTSVKDFYVEQQPSGDSLGRGSFIFTDRYSVFDWGEMPDRIPGKGSTLCIMGAYNFELLEDEGVPTHYRGVEENSGVIPLDNAVTPVSTMAIDLTQVPDLPYREGSYNYDEYFAEADENYLIPLEIVFRNRIPTGSSLRRRKSPSDLGLPHEDWPEEVVELEEPIVEFSTKYEEKDRYLSSEEADRIAGKAELEALRTMARRVNEVICNRAEVSGMTHDDGKIECLYHQGEIQVADVVGTFDENRFTRDGDQISKEVIRQYYRKNHPEWLDAIDEAKRTAREEDHEDWRVLVDVSPPSLPEPVLESVTQMYKAGANAYTGREWFDVPSLDEVLQTLNRQV